MCRKVLISCKNVLNKCLFFWTPCIQPSSRAYIFPVRIKEKIIFMAGVSLHLTCQHIFTMFYLNLYLYKLQNFKYLKNRNSERKKERMCKNMLLGQKLSTGVIVVASKMLDLISTTIFPFVG